MRIVAGSDVAFVRRLEHFSGKLKNGQPSQFGFAPQAIPRCRAPYPEEYLLEWKFG
jgi:hypothetical protein